MAVIAAAGASIVAKAGKKAGDYIASRGIFSDLAAPRNARVREAYNAALAGNAAELGYLLARAGLGGTATVPTAPKETRDVARRLVAQYYATTGEQPPAEIAGVLGMAAPETPQSAANRIRAAAERAAGSVATDVERVRVEEIKRSVLPWIVGGALIVGAFILSRRKG